MSFTLLCRLRYDSHVTESGLSWEFGTVFAIILSQDENKFNL